MKKRIRLPGLSLFRMMAALLISLTFASPLLAQYGTKFTDRTFAETKLDSNLIQAVRAVTLGLAKSNIPASAFPGVQSFVDQNVAADQTILVVINANPTPGLLAALQASGASEISEFPLFKTVTARVPIGAVLDLAARDDVMSIGHNAPPQTNRYIPTAEEMDVRFKGISAPIGNAATITWQGVSAHKADLAIAVGKTGAGVSVCVLSDGVDHLSTSQAAQELGTVTVLPGQAWTGDEGTAMLEIVHDMAPGANLFYATGMGGEAQMATNILALRNSYACDIVVDDLVYPLEGAFQDGPIAQAVNTVTAAGAMYFSSAGNSGNLTHGASGTFEGDFVSSASMLPPAIASIKNAPGAVLQSFGANPYTTLTAAATQISLQWSDPLGGSGNDYDLYVMDSSGSTVIAYSNASQTGTQNPFEFVQACDGCSYPVGARIYVVKYSGATRAIRLDTHRAQILNGTTGSTVGHNAAASAITVAAVNVNIPGGGAFVGGSANPVEFFSSDGPRKMFYKPDGTAITPGNLLFATNGGTTLSKVDIAAANCGNTSVAGFQFFCGTSAAAPTAASLAAVIKSASPGASNTTVMNALKGSALDIEAAGSDRDSGVGIVMTPRAVYAIKPTAPSGVTALAGNTSIQVSFTPGSIGTGTFVRYFAVCTSDNFVTAFFSNDVQSPVTVSGLTNGLTYFCQAQTQTTDGYSPWSANSNSVIPVALPEAPTIVTAIADNQSISVYFTPGNIGTGSLVKYWALCTADNRVTMFFGNAMESPIVVGNLTNGLAYQCQAQAQGTLGEGPWSAYASAVTPAVKPQAPTNVSAVAGDKSITVAFTPGNIGTGTLAKYWALCTPDNRATMFFGSAMQSPIVVDNLANGLAYSCQVQTQGTFGEGPWSAYATTVTPAARPGPPTNVTAVAVPGGIRVSFASPVDQGGSVMVSYTVSCAAAGQATVTKTGASSPITVTRLKPDTSYSCTVTDNNTAYASVASAPVSASPLLGPTIDLTPILMLLLD